LEKEEPEIRQPAASNELTKRSRPCQSATDSRYLNDRKRGGGRDRKKSLASKDWSGGHNPVQEAGSRNGRGKVKGQHLGSGYRGTKGGKKRTGPLHIAGGVTTAGKSRSQEKKDGGKGVRSTSTL